MKFSQKQLVIIGAAGFVVLIAIVLIFTNLRSKQNAAVFTLKVWGIDNKQAMDPIIQAYHQARPGATVDYTQVDAANYENTLVNALASGQGPDVFYIGNRELPKQKDRIVPLDPTQFPGTGITSFRALFPTAPEQDFVSGGQIYAMPLYIDTLALLYNKDFFDQAAIVAPPATWDDFQSDVAKLRVVNQNGQITRAGAAIGGTEKTVDSGVDLLNLLMLQNGTQMISNDLTQANFDGTSQATVNAGGSAFNFYLQFANAGSPYFTWNEGQPNSLDSFASGKTAMILDYQSSIPTIMTKSPFLKFGVAPIPQPTGATLSIAYPKYYGLAVSKQSTNQHWAWDFILYLTTAPGNAKIYANATGHPPALRAMIGALADDPTLGVFERQALTARTWYEVDDTAIDTIFNSAIESVLTGQTDSRTALRQAQDQVSQLMQAHGKQ